MKKSSRANKRSPDAKKPSLGLDRDEMSARPPRIPPPPPLPKMALPSLAFDMNDVEEEPAPDSHVRDLHALASTVPPPMVVEARHVDEAVINLANGFGNELLTRPAPRRWMRVASQVAAVAVSLSLGYAIGASRSAWGPIADQTAASSSIETAASFVSARRGLQTQISPLTQPAEAVPAASPEVVAPTPTPEVATNNIVAARPTPPTPRETPAAREKAAENPPEATSSEGSEAEEPKAPQTLVEAISAPPFERETASASLAIAASQAATCGAREGLQGRAQVRVVFSPTGRVTSATVMGGQLLGTETGSCVARAMRTASVPAFAGPPVAVIRNVNVR